MIENGLIPFDAIKSGHASFDDIMRAAAVMSFDSAVSKALTPEPKK
ncbi:hypothetical protein [Serratia marcescens]|nr:hypothetical protein [Serratia marcescens]